MAATQKQIYLDFASATPVSEAVVTAMQPYFSDKFYNPSALYLAGKAVRADMESARAKVARILGCRPSEVVFTAGGTEANNLAIHGAMRGNKGGQIVASTIEHPSVLGPAGEYDLRLAAVNAGGIVDLDALEQAITEETVLISIMYANNEIGTIQPIANIAKIVAEVRTDRQRRGIVRPLLLHVDACQASNYLALNVHRLGVDMMTLNGGKMYGPKQSGVLYVRAGVRLEPYMLGGGQESGLRSGTENVSQAIGFAEALQSAQDMRAKETKRLTMLRDEFLEQLLSSVDGLSVNGSLRERLANNVHVTINAQDNERLLMQLDERGLQCATGSACSASSEEPSQVLRAIGLSEASARSSLRFSLGRTTTQAQLAQVVKVLQQLTAV